MEILEQELDEIFDLNPFLAEMYSNSSSSTTSSVVSDHGGTTTTATATATAAAFETIIRPSSSTIAPIANHPLLISFENDIFHGTNADNCDMKPQIISFSSSDELGKRERGGHGASPAAATRTALQAQDHVMAERKRRDNLRQLFISLSKVVPGLKKLDKASLLEDAINYLKVLQERVTALEREDEIISSNNNIIGVSPSTSNNMSSSGSEISVRISNRNVLIKICCKKEKELMSRIPCELERMLLSVRDIRIMPFGGAALDVTILAEMQSGFVGSVEDIGNHLQGVVGQLVLRN